MKTSIRFILPATLTCALLGSPAWAQTPDASAPAATAPMTAPGGARHAPRRAQHRADFIDQRLTRLHDQLNITPQQQQQWDAFAQVMRDSAQKTEDAYRERAQKLPTLNADDAMKSYADLAQMHADNTKSLASAFSTLYAALSDDQKKNADVLFRYQQQKQNASRARRHRPAPSGASAAAATPTPASGAKQ